MVQISALAKLRTLSVREKSVLSLLVRGMSDKAIATELDISLNTVKSHGVSIRNKVGLDNRTEVAMWAVRHKVVEP